MYIYLYTYTYIYAYIHIHIPVSNMSTDPSFFGGKERGGGIYALTGSYHMWSAIQPRERERTRERDRERKRE